MMLPFLIFLSLLQSSSSGTPGADTDGIKIKARYDVTNSNYEQTIYLQRDRSRTELRDKTGAWLKGVVPVIVRCDLGLVIELNEKSHEYLVRPYPFLYSEAEAPFHHARTTPIYETDKPTLRIETTIKDTGEQKELFGRTARHIISTEQVIPLAGLPSTWPIETATVTEGWVIDLIPFTSCEQRTVAEVENHHYSFYYPDTPIQRIEYVKSGKEPIGLPVVRTTMTQYRRILPSGKVDEYRRLQEDRVIKIEETPLDRSLFEVPAGYIRVNAFKD